jgi:broad specificity phosphatase PhoE
MTRPTTVTLPGGESWTHLRARTLAARRDIVARHAGSAVAVVAHGGVTRAILADVLGLPDEHLFRLEQSYGGLSIVDEIDGVPIARVINGGWSA